MCPVVPSKYPDVFNMLAKARMFKGCKVSAAFMVEVFCLLDLQSRIVYLVGLQIKKKMLPTCHLVLGSLYFQKNALSNARKKIKQQRTKTKPSGKKEFRPRLALYDLSASSSSWNLISYASLVFA